MFLRRTSPGRMAAAAIALAPVIAVLAGPVTAASAGTQPTCGEVLTVSVTLTANLDCSADTAGPALTIGASGITINLNGYAILGPGGSADTQGIYADSSQAYANVTVEHGTIQDFEYDVSITGDRSLTLKSLNLVLDGTNNYDGVYANSIAGGTFTGLTGANAEYAVELVNSSKVKVTSSDVTSSSIGFFDEYSTDDSYLHDNASNNSGGGGFTEGYSAGDIFDYSTADNDDIGFYIEGAGYGVATLHSDQASHNAAEGFYLYENYGANYPVPHEVVTGNTADYNGTAGISDKYSIDATVRGNHASYNGEYGINLVEPVGYTVKSNVTDHNTSTGLYLEDNESYYNVKTASFNKAYYNSDYGLYADYAAPGSDNAARHNTPFDCYNFACTSGSTAPVR